MSTTEDNFLEAFLAIEAIEPPTLEYRLYYDELGNVVGRSSHEHLEGNNYVVVTKEEYDNYFHYKIFDGKLEEIVPQTTYRTEVTLGRPGYTVPKRHAGIVLEEGEEYSDTENYGNSN